VNDFLFVVIELFSLALTAEALQSKTCQDSLLSGEGRSPGANISGEGVVPGEYVFGFYKNRHILLSDSANCTVLCSRFDTIPACDKRTDRQTDGNAITSTALAVRALRSAVKSIRQGTPPQVIAKVKGAWSNGFSN